MGGRLRLVEDVGVLRYSRLVLTSAEAKNTTRREWVKIENTVFGLSLNRQESWLKVIAGAFAERLEHNSTTQAH